MRVSDDPPTASAELNSLISKSSSERSQESLIKLQLLNLQVNRMVRLAISHKTPLP